MGYSHYRRLPLITISTYAARLVVRHGRLLEESSDYLTRIFRHLNGRVYELRTLVAGVQFFVPLSTPAAPTGTWAVPIPPHWPLRIYLSAR
jgi:hypothetical protein